MFKNPRSTLMCATMDLVSCFKASKYEDIVYKIGYYVLIISALSPLVGDAPLQSDA